MRSNSVGGAGILERPVEFFVLSMLFCLASPGLLGAFTTDLVSITVIMWPGLILIWAVSAFWARERVKPKAFGDGDILVRWGHPPRRGTVIGHCLYIAAVAGNIFVLTMAFLAPALTVTEPPASPLEGLIVVAQPIIRWSVILLAGTFTILAVFGARATNHDIRDFETKYSSPQYHDTLLAAREERVILGHEFARIVGVAVSSAASPTTIVESLPGEIIGRTVEKVIGQEGPFELDLEKERNPHLVCVGASGSGKTQTVLAVLLRYWVARRIPSLVLDWTGEYADFIRRIGGVVWSVPTNFTINPLNLSGLSPAARAAEVEESLTFSIDLTPLQAAEVGRTILSAYRERGILEEDKSSWSLQPPTLHDIIQIMESKSRSGYYTGQEFESVNWTLRKMYRVLRVFGEEPTDFFETILRVPTCIDMSGLRGVDIAKALVSYAVLQRIYERFDVKGFSPLRLLIVIDEAHRILKTEQQKAVISEEPLPVRIVRAGRKYGFGLVISSQLASDAPEALVTNTATVIAMQFDEPHQVNYIKKWLNLSKTELEIFGRLPRGGCFIKSLGKRYPALVKVQMASPDEFRAARTLAQLVLPYRVAKATQPSTPPPSLTPKTRGEPAAPVAPPPTPILELIQSKGPELTGEEAKILRTLLKGPTTMKALSQKCPNIDYRSMLNILHALESEGLVQSERVPNLEGKSTVFYAALKGDWLRSESMTHRAMLDIIEHALIMQRPVRFTQSHADYPDLGLENTLPKICIEVETGRKKLTAAELEKWAAGVKQRNRKLGYKDTLVVVRNSAIEARYKDSCEKYGLELTTMAKLGAKLQEKQEGEGCSPA